MLQQRISIFTLGVRDIGRSRSFYADTLGWTPQSESGDIVFFNLGGPVLALYNLQSLADDIGPSVPVPDRAGYNGFTLAHNVGSIGEVDRIFKELSGAGVEILKSPQHVFWGGYSGYFADPDGHPWEVAYNPYWTVASSDEGQS